MIFKWTINELEWLIYLRFPSLFLSLSCHVLKTLTLHGSIIINKMKFMCTVCMHSSEDPFIMRLTYLVKNTETARACCRFTWNETFSRVTSGLLKKKQHVSMSSHPMACFSSNTSHMKRDGIFMFYEEIYFMSMQHDWKAWSGKMFDLESFQLHRMKEIDGRFVFSLVCRILTMLQISFYVFKYSPI